MTLRNLVLAVCAALMWTAPAQAQITLNFSGLDGDEQERVLNYYNGGTGSLGSGPGANYGISFSSNAIVCSVKPGGTCNSAKLPSGGNLLFFLDGGAATMNVAAGFDTGFSFFYSAVNNPASINVWSGLNGTGTLLASLNLPTTPNGSANADCLNQAFCPYVPIGVSFRGTALSVDFGGSVNQAAFADITLGSVTPGVGAVPEPATWAMMIAGFGLVGGTLRRRRAKVAFAA